MTLQDLIIAALKEDLPEGDITTDNLALSPRFGQAKLIAKEDLVLSGCDPFEQTLLTMEPSAKIMWHFPEGKMVLAKQTVCNITGDLVQILKAERVALNFIGHLSGIATFTRCFVREVEHTKAKILDTRKTMPVYRDLEKKAVLHGGGTSHRKNLSAAILIKDNHIQLAGSVSKAISRIRANTTEPVEVECADLAQVHEAIALKAERILLDNMSDDMTKKALQIIDGRAEVEASGNMSLSRVRSVADLGVDFISIGALTHSAPNADFSVLFEWQSLASESVGI